MGYRRDQYMQMQRAIDGLGHPRQPSLFTVRHCLSAECPHYRKSAGESEYKCHRSPKHALDVQKGSNCKFGLEKKA